MSLTLDGTTGVTTTGNVTAAYLFGNASQLTGISSSKIYNGTSEANIGVSGGNANISIGGTSNVAVFTTTGANITGTLTATGNITGNYLLGNGTFITGLSASKIFNGTSEANIGTSGGNANITIGGTSNVVVVASSGVTISGTLNTGTGNANVGNIGATAVVATNLTGTLQTASQTNITSVGTLGSLTVTGNITGGNILGGANVNATTHTGTTVSVTGNISGGNLSASTGSLTCGSIVNANANGVGNIGSSTLYFNTVFAKATSAQYADLAENYVADKDYPVGTVLRFGGQFEVTETINDHETSVAGTVSDKPAYVMNAGLSAEHVATVALMGRVPCRVIGTIKKGDLIVASEIHGVGTALDSNLWQPGCVVGKSLENYDSDQEGLIEVVVGRL